jgi:hypothetical protein
MFCQKLFFSSSVIVKLLSLGCEEPCKGFTPFRAASQGFY